VKQERSGGRVQLQTFIAGVWSLLIGLVRTTLFCEQIFVQPTAANHHSLIRSNYEVSVPSSKKNNDADFRENFVKISTYLQLASPL